MRGSLYVRLCVRETVAREETSSPLNSHMISGSEGLARESDILSLNDVPALRRPGNDGASCGGRVYECMCVHMFLCVKV